MSGLFLINIKKDWTSFDEMDDLSKRIVRIALKENKGVFFNSCDYDEDLLSDIGKIPFVLISNSFLYQNCDFLDTSEFDVNDKNIQIKFNKKYNFINSFFVEFNKFGVTELDIYISNDGSVSTAEDFVIQKTVKSQDFLDSLLSSIYEYSDIYAYGFPTIKYTVII